MTVNEKNINRLIEIVRGDRETHFRMQRWITGVDPLSPESGEELEFGSERTPSSACGTAACLSGHIALEIFRQTENESVFEKASKYWQEKPAFAGGLYGDISHYASNIEQSAGWLGITPQAARQLFLMIIEGESESWSTSSRRVRFDALPPECRTLFAVRVLEHLRDTGVADWKRVLPASVWEGE